jgi:hypothetical protein
MFGITNETRVYLKTGVTDGRLSYEGLRGLVSKVIAQDVRAGHLFAFCNRRDEQTTFRIPILHRCYRVSMASFVWKEGGIVPTYRSSWQPSCPP